MTNPSLIAGSNIQSLFLRPLFYIIYYLLNAAATPDLFPILLTAPLLLLIVVNVTLAANEYVSPVEIWWYTIYLFFVIGPLQSIQGNHFGRDDDPLSSIVTSHSYTQQEMITAMLVVFLFCIGFSFSYYIMSYKAPSTTTLQQQNDPNMDRTFFLLVGVNVLSFLLFIQMSGGLENTLAPRMEKSADDLSLFRPLALALQSVSLAMLVAIDRLLRPRRSLAVGALLVCVILLAIAQNPVNSSRFFLIAVWLPSLLTLCKGRFKSVYMYALSILAMVVFFPIVSVTSRFGLSRLPDAMASISGGDFLRLQFIDVFDTLVHCVRYMEDKPFLLGQKTNAILLFFIPRTLWPEKPIVGGLDIGTDLFETGMAGTSNLSMFAGGDLYMDFSLIGPILGGLFVGALLYKGERTKLGISYGQRILGYLIIASLPILIRGPLGAVIALFASQVGVVIALARLTGTRMRKGQPAAAQARFDNRVREGAKLELSSSGHAAVNSARFAREGDRSHEAGGSTGYFR